MLTRCRNCRGINPELSIPIGGTVCDCATNPKYIRYALISVQAPQDWLTDDGNCSHEEGWKEMEEQLRKALTPPSLTRYVKVEFEEWDGEPEQAA